MPGSPAMKARLALALVLGAVSLVLAAPVPVSADVPGTPPTPALELPADLTALERTMLALPVTSETFKATVTVSGSSGSPTGPLGSFARIRPRAHSAGSAPLVAITGEIAFTSPLQARAHLSLLGLKSELLLIGSDAFDKEPFAARFDGGRPWIVHHGQNIEQALGVELSTLGAQPGSGATDAFGDLVADLAKAHAIAELGPRTIDGQETTAFDARVYPSELGHSSAAKRRAIAKLAPGLAHLEVFIAADGVPVRVRLRLALHVPHQKHSPELATESDILALNAPVAPVIAPAPSQTITEANLTRLIEKAVRKHRATEKQH